ATVSTVPDESALVAPAAPTLPMSWFDQSLGAGGADWFAVNAWPPTLTVAERAPPVFAAALTATAPFPLPDPPLVIVSQPALLVPVHGHQLPTPTSNVPVSPAYDID